MSLQTGPKGVIQDYRRYKQLETEQRKEKEKEIRALAQKFSVSCQSSVSCYHYINNMIHLKYLWNFYKCLVFDNACYKKTAISCPYYKIGLVKKGPLLACDELLYSPLKLSYIPLLNRGRSGHFILSHLIP